MLRQNRHILSLILVALFTASWVSVWVHIASEDHEAEHAEHHHEADPAHHSEIPSSTGGHESHSLDDHELNFDAVVVKYQKQVVHVWAVLDVDLEYSPDIIVFGRMAESVFRPPKSVCSSSASNRAPPSILS